jgi:glutathione S-transferase
MVLNYKRLKFQNQWVPTTRIEATCKALGIGPTATKPDGRPHYTLPAIIDRTNPAHPVVLSDSIPIIEYLERTYPAASPDTALFPPGTREMQMQFNLGRLMKIIWAVPEIAANAHYASKIEMDKAELRCKFERVYGKAFEQIERRGVEREASWRRLEQHFKCLGDMIDKNERGKFLMGDRVRFMDFALCGCMMFIKCLSPHDAWVRICSWHGGRWAQYFDAFHEWMELGGPPMKISVA